MGDNSERERGCAYGRIKIDHVMEGHYEFHVWQDGGIMVNGQPVRAYVCLTARQLKEVAEMIGEMFPESPDKVERKFSHDAGTEMTGYPAPPKPVTHIDVDLDSLAAALRALEKREAGGE